MFFTSERLFRKLSSGEMQFSRTRFPGPATYGRWARLKLNPRQDKTFKAHH
jgi:hypothetical protein